MPNALQDVRRSSASQPDGLMCRNADTLKLLNETEKKLKQQQTEAYIDLDKAAEEREAGNKVRHAHVQRCVQLRPSCAPSSVHRGQACLPDPSTLQRGSVCCGGAATMAHWCCHNASMARSCIMVRPLVHALRQRPGSGRPSQDSSSQRQSSTTQRPWPGAPPA